MPTKKTASGDQAKSDGVRTSLPQSDLERAKTKIENAFALAKEGDFGGIDVLMTSLHDSSWSVRSSAAHYLGRLGPQGAISDLSVVAKSDSQSETRNVAIYALASVGRGACIPPLMDCLNDADAARRDDARTALMRVIGDEIAPLLADEMELYDDSTGQPGKDPDEINRLKTWFDGARDQFAPNKVYFFGFPAHPEVLINHLRDNLRLPSDAIYSKLEDWTGKSFKSTSAKKTLEKWDRWVAEHGNEFTAGAHYFWGHQVD